MRAAVAAALSVFTLSCASSSSEVGSELLRVETRGYTVIVTGSGDEPLYQVVAKTPTADAGVAPALDRDAFAALYPVLYERIANAYAARPLDARLWE